MVLLLGTHSIPTCNNYTKDINDFIHLQKYVKGIVHYEAACDHFAIDSILVVWDICTSQ